jgi:hypothetical protein
LTAVTLRYLAGGRILDLGWPNDLSDSTVYGFMDETIDAIDATLQNITFPSTADNAEREAAACVRALADTCMIRVESLRPVRSDETVSCTLWHI